MPHRLYPVLDSVICMLASVALAISNLLFADVAADSYLDLRMLLLPMLGSMLVSSAFIMLNPNPDTRRITIGRGILALFVGTLLPDIIASMHPALAAVNVKPALLMLIGGGISGFVYVLSKPFTKHLYQRADRIAARQVAALEKKHFPAATRKPRNSDTENEN